MKLNHRVIRLERHVHDMGGSIQCRFCLDGKAGDAAETQALDGSRVPISNDATFTYDEQGRCIHCGCQRTALAAGRFNTERSSSFMEAEKCGRRRQIVAEATVTVL